MGTLLGWVLVALIAGSLLALVAIGMGCVLAGLALQRGVQRENLLREDLDRELTKILRHPATQEHPSF